MSATYNHYRVMPGPGAGWCFAASATAVTLAIPPHWRGREVLFGAQGCLIYGACVFDTDPSGFTANSGNPSTVASNVVTGAPTLQLLVGANTVVPITIPHKATFVRIQNDGATGNWYAYLKNDSKAM